MHFHIKIKETCDLPLHHNIALPIPCDVFYYSGEQVTTSIVNIGRCSEELCVGNSGLCGEENVRCCCQPLMYRNIEYQCGNEPQQIFSRMTTTCGCKLCNISISFLGLVMDNERNPLPLANVLIDGMTSVTADIYGMFGFMVSGLQSRVEISTSIVPYAPYQASHAVVPGGVNFVYIQLLAMEVASFTSPKPNPTLLISAMNLVRYSSIAEFVSSFSNTKGDSLMSFQGGFFGNLSIDDIHFQVLPVQMDSQNDMLQVRTSFVTPNSETMSKRQTTGPPEHFVSVIAYGSLQMVNDLGENITIITSSMPLSIITYTSSSLYEQSEVEALRLFIYNKDTGKFDEQDIVPDIQKQNGKFVIIFTVSNISLPITYIIGWRGVQTCYAVVRVFKTQDREMNGKEAQHPVIFVTRHPSRREVSLIRGESKQCLPIPCTGELTITVDVQYFHTYHPSEINFNLPGGFPETLGKIHATFEDCETYGIQSDNAMYFFAIMEVTEMPDTPPTDTLEEIHSMDIEMYCYINLQVIHCDDQRVMASLINTFEHSGRSITRHRMIGKVEDGPEDYVQGSGDGCQITEEICFEYVCDPVSHINISVSHCPSSSVCAMEEYVHCYPVIDRHDSLTNYEVNSKLVSSPFVAFNSTVSKPGIYYSEDSRDIAFYKCELNGTVALKYECLPSSDLQPA